MTTLTLYWWQRTYDSAVLETDPARMSDCVKAALTAIEERLRSCIEYGGPEDTAIEEARRTLSMLKVKMVQQGVAVRKKPRDIKLPNIRISPKRR
jgi:hypothetical protein